MTLSQTMRTCARLPIEYTDQKYFKIARLHKLFFCCCCIFTALLSGDNGHALHLIYSYQIFIRIWEVLMSHPIQDSFRRIFLCWNKELNAILFRQIFCNFIIFDMAILFAVLSCVCEADYHVKCWKLDCHLFGVKWPMRCVIHASN